MKTQIVGLWRDGRGWKHLLEGNLSLHTHVELAAYSRSRGRFIDCMTFNPEGPTLEGKDNKVRRLLHDFKEAIF